MNISNQSLNDINSKIQTANLRLYDKLIEDILLKYEFFIFVIFLLIVLVILNVFWLIVTNIYFKKYINNLARNRFYTHMLKPPQTTNSLDIEASFQELNANNGVKDKERKPNVIRLRIEEKCEKSFKYRVKQGADLMSEIHSSIMKKSKSFDAKKIANRRLGGVGSTSSPLLHLKTNNESDNGSRMNFDRDEYVRYKREREDDRQNLEKIKESLKEYQKEEHHKKLLEQNRRSRLTGTSGSNLILNSDGCVIDTSTPADSSSLTSIDNEID